MKALTLLFAMIASVMMTCGLVMCFGAMIMNQPDNFILGAVACLTGFVVCCAGVFASLVEAKLV